MEDLKMIKATGEVRDIIKYQDGRVVDTGWSENAIVLDFNILIASLLKAETGYKGIQYWAIGSGEASWDLPSVYETSELTLTGGATSTGAVTIGLNGVSSNVMVASGDTATQVATKIRNAGYNGWTTSGTGTKVIFVCNTDGGKIDATLSVGTTGVTGNMVTTVQGVEENPRPEAKPTDKGCKTEIYRKKINVGDIKFVDALGIETVTPTHRLQVSMIFNDTEAVGSWREFAIFGGNATVALKSGLAINHKTHALIEKTNTMTVERIIRFTFE